MNKEITATSTEKREIELPDGRTLTGLVKIIRRQPGWGKNEKIAEKEAQAEAACIKPLLDKLADVLPDYFNPSRTTAFEPGKLQGSELGSDNGAIAFLSDARIHITGSGLKILEPKLIRVRLYPPFLLNELAASLRASVPIVPPYLDTPIRVSAELIWDKAHIQVLSTTEQDLRVYPSTEWLWNVEPQQSGKTDAFVKFTIFVGRDQFSKGIPIVYPLSYEVEPDWRKSTQVFLIENWKWIAGTVVIPLAIFLFHSFWPAKAATLNDTKKTSKRRNQ